MQVDQSERTRASNPRTPLTVNLLQAGRAAPASVNGNLRPAHVTERAGVLLMTSKRTATRTRFRANDAGAIPARDVDELDGARRTIEINATLISIAVQGVEDDDGRGFEMTGTLREALLDLSEGISTAAIAIEAITARAKGGA